MLAGAAQAACAAAVLEEACRRQGGEPTSAEIARELKGNRSLSEINARIAALSRGLASSDVQREVIAC